MKGNSKIINRNSIWNRCAFLIIICFLFQGCVGGFFSKIGLTNNVTDTINHAISEADDILETLGETAEGITGEAGEQVRETVSEVTNSASTLLNELESTSGGILNQTESSVVKILKELTSSLTQINDLLLKDIDCVDKVLANTLANFTDNSIKLIDKLSSEVNYTVDNLANNIIETTDFLGNKVALIGSQVTTWIVRIILLLFAMVLAFWQIKILNKWVSSQNKRSFWQYILPVVSLSIAGVATYLFFTPVLVHSFVGQTMTLPEDFDQWKAECDAGASIYSEFIELYKGGKQNEAIYTESGLKAINQISHCIYVSNNDQLEDTYSQLIDKIQTILFPPPPVSAPSYANCVDKQGNRSISIHPMWTSIRTLKKIKIVEELSQQRIIVRQRYIPKIQNLKTKIPSISTPDNLNKYKNQLKEFDIKADSRKLQQIRKLNQHKR